MRRPALLLGVQVAAVTAILGCVLALAALHPRRLDLTPERRFTLSPYTREVLGRLAGDVRITLFYSSQAGALRREMTDLLTLYQEAQPHVTVRAFDLDRSPGMAKRLGVSNYNTAVVEAGERREAVEVVSEEAVTAALLAVAGTPPVATYFVVGHGERDPRDTDERRGASEAARALAAEGFRTGVLEGTAAVPADAGLVVVAGPTRDLRPAEVEALAAYVAGGGNALLLCDPGTPPSVAALVRRFGVELAPTTSPAPPKARGRTSTAGRVTAPLSGPAAIAAARCRSRPSRASRWPGDGRAASSSSATPTSRPTCTWACSATATCCSPRPSWWRAPTRSPRRARRRRRAARSRRSP